MAAIEALYLQDPFWLWLALACLLVSLNLATGSSLMMWPGIAAVMVALIELAGLRLGPAVEAGVFAALTAAAFGVLFARRRGAPLETQPGEPRPAEPKRAEAKRAGASQRSPGRAASGRQDQTARLIGRIGRSSGEFVNGVGRVWIDGAEWGAELEGGDDALPDGAPVRVVRVMGGIRLQVHALNVG